MDLQDAGAQARLLLRDRDGKYPDLFAAVLADAAIEVVLSGARMPRMNAIMDRWVQIRRHELLDHTLIWTRLTCCTLHEISSTSTTSIGRTRASRTPELCAHCAS